MPLGDGDLGRITLLWCNHRHWTAKAITGGQPLTSFRLWHVAAGCIEVDTGTAVVRYTAGQWVSAPRSFQRQTMFVGTELISLSLDWHLADGTSPLHRIPDGVLDLGRHGPRLRSLLLAQSRLEAQLRAAKTTADADLARLALARSGLWRIAALLMELYPQPTDGRAEEVLDSRVAQALRTVRLHVRGRFPVGRLERVTGVGRRRLEQLFSARMGMTPRAYHAKLRMEEARSLVTQGRMQIKEIAATLAYASQSAFTQAFIRSYGISPSAYQTRERT